MLGKQESCPDWIKVLRISLVNQGGAPFVPCLNLCVIVCSFCVSPRAAVAAVVVQVERLDLRRRVELASRAEARKEVSQGILKAKLRPHILHYLHLAIEEHEGPGTSFAQ